MGSRTRRERSASKSCAMGRRLSASGLQAPVSNVRFGSRLCKNAQPGPPHDDFSRLRFFGEAKRPCRGHYGNFLNDRKIERLRFYTALVENGRSVLDRDLKPDYCRDGLKVE